MQPRQVRTGPGHLTGASNFLAGSLRTSSCSGLLFGAGRLRTLPFGRRFDRRFGGLRSARFVCFRFGGGSRLFFFAFVRDVRTRRRDDLPGALGAYALDIKVLLIGFRQLLGGAEAP